MPSSYALVLDALRRLGGIATLSGLVRFLEQSGVKLTRYAVRSALEKLQRWGVVAVRSLQLGRDVRCKVDIWVVKDQRPDIEQFLLRELGGLLQRVYEYIRTSRGTVICLKHYSICKDCSDEEANIRKWTLLLELIRLAAGEAATVYETKRGVKLCVDSSTDLVRMARERDFADFVKHLADKLAKIIAD